MGLNFMSIMTSGSYGAAYNVGDIVKTGNKVDDIKDASKTVNRADNVNDALKGANKSVTVGELDSPPQNARNMYNKYDSSGWKGSVSSQTLGTAAGSKYLNRDAKLPPTDGAGNLITYKEFDVNNKLPNAERDAQRFVRGSNGSVYYTDDHYSTFTQIK